MSGPRGRDVKLDRRRHDGRGIERLVADENRDAVPRLGGERLERRDRRACARSVGLGPLDVERGGEPDALPRSDQAQRLVVGRRDGAHGFELASRADQREIARRDVGQHQQAHSAHAVLGGHCVGGGCLGARAQAARKVDLPGNIHAAGNRPDLGVGLAGAPAITVVVALARDPGPHVRQHRGAADRYTGARGAHALGCDLDVAVRDGGAADEAREHGIAVAFPPRDLGLILGGQSLGELAGHLDLGLYEGGRAPGEGESKQEK